MTSNELFKKRLRELRLEKNMTLQALSSESGIAVSSISRYEKGERTPKIEQINRLATALGVSDTYLQGITNYRDEHEAHDAFVAETRADSEAFVHRKYSVLDPFIASNPEKYDQAFLLMETLFNIPADSIETLDTLQKRRIAWVIESLLETPSQIADTNSSQPGSIDRFIDVMVTAANNWYEPSQPAKADNVTGYQYQFNN